MLISEDGIDFLIKQEGFRAYPYLCNRGVATIGNGTTMYPDGSKVTINDPPITKEYARELLKAHLAKEVYPLINKHIKSALNQKQFDALCSFIYNLGPQALINKNGSRTGINMRVNTDPNDPLIEKEFDKWDRRNPPVHARHMREARLYFGGTLPSESQEFVSQDP